MKSQLIILYPILLLSISICYGQATKIKVCVKPGVCDSGFLGLKRFQFPDQEMVIEFDIERQTVLDIGQQYCVSKGLNYNSSLLRVRNSQGKQYKLNQTIKQAKIEEKQVVYVKCY